jgi:hypothetical protein
LFELTLFHEFIHSAIIAFAFAVKTKAFTEWDGTEAKDTVSLLKSPRSRCSTISLIVAYWLVSSPISRLSENVKSAAAAPG